MTNGIELLIPALRRGTGRGRHSASLYSGQVATGAYKNPDGHPPASSEIHILIALAPSQALHSPQLKFRQQNCHSTLF